MGKRFQNRCNSMFCWTENLSDAEAEEERYVKKHSVQPDPVKPKAPRKSKVEAALVELDKMYENMIAAIVRLRGRFKAADRNHADVLGKYICDQSEAQQRDAVDKKGKPANAPHIAECSSKITNQQPTVCGNRNEKDERRRIESPQRDAKAKENVVTLGEPALVQSLPQFDVSSILIIVNGDSDYGCEDVSNEDNVGLPKSPCNPNESQSLDESTYIPPGLDVQLLDRRFEKLYNPPTLDDLLDQVLQEVVTKDKRKEDTDIKKSQEESVLKLCRPFDEVIGNGVTDECGC